MGRYKTIGAYVDVQVNLDEWDTDDLIQELERRECDYNTNDVDADDMKELLEQVWLKRRTGKDYQLELDQLIYGVLGKVV